jgi:hypothetical protein
MAGGSVIYVVSPQKGTRGRQRGGFGHRRTSPSLSFRVSSSSRETSVTVIASAPTSFLYAIASASCRLRSATTHSSDRAAPRPRLNSPRNFHPAPMSQVCAVGCPLSSRKISPRRLWQNFPRTWRRGLARQPYRCGPSSRLAAGTGRKKAVSVGGLCGLCLDDQP